MGRKIERLRSGEIYNKREAEKERNQIERKKGKTGKRGKTEREKRHGDK